MPKDQPTPKNPQKRNKHRRAMKGKAGKNAARTMRKKSHKAKVADTMRRATIAKKRVEASKIVGDTMSLASNLKSNGA